MFGGDYSSSSPLLGENLRRVRNRSAGLLSRLRYHKVPPRIISGMPMQNMVRLWEFGLPKAIETNKINNPTININKPTLLINMGIIINEMGETSNVVSPISSVVLILNSSTW